MRMNDLEKGGWVLFFKIYLNNKIDPVSVWTIVRKRNKYIPVCLLLLLLPPFCLGKMDSVINRLSTRNGGILFYLRRVIY